MSRAEFMSGQDLAALRSRVVDSVDSMRDEIQQTSRWLFDHPELSGDEYQASALLASRAEARGFKVERGVAGLPTAFSALKRPDFQGPRVAFLAEYDALPVVGHGCGHNLIGTAGTYAAIALSTVTEHLDGDVALFGTPAEETDGGKITMLDAGIFDGVTAALMVHPGIHTEVAYASLACTSLVVEYRGKTAHAAAAPWRGINALDALIQLFVSIDLVRRQLQPSARIAGVITSGGDRANVVPDFAQAQFSIRGRNREEMEQVRKKVITCAEAAALAIGASLSFYSDGNDYLEMRPNARLAAAYRNEWVGVGGAEPSTEARPHGSLDIGNLSHRFPCLHPSVSITTDDSINGHSREFAAATVTPYAVDQIIKAIKALALTGLSVLAGETRLVD